MDSNGNELRTYTATTKDVAAHFGVGRSSVYTWLKTTDIPHRRVGGLIRFNLAEVDEWSSTRAAEEGAA